MEGITLEIVIIGMTLLLAGIVVAFMMLVVKSGKKTMRNRRLFTTLEKHAESQDRLISLLRDRKTAGDFD